MPDLFIFLCNCGWRKVSQIENCGLLELKNDTLSSRKFRCPSCGFSITPFKTKDPQYEINKKNIEKEIEEENKKWLEESSEKQAEFVKEIENAEKNIN